YRFFGVSLGDCVLIDWTLNNLFISHQRNVERVDIQSSIGFPKIQVLFVIFKYCNIVHIVTVGYPKIVIKTMTGWKKFLFMSQLPLPDTGSCIACALHLLR